MAKVVFEEAELEDSIMLIITGRKIISMDGELYLLTYPSMDDLNMSRFIYEQRKEYAISSGLSTEKEILDYIKKSGIFTEESEQKIKRLRKEIDSALETTLKLKSENARKVAEDHIEKLKEELYALYSEKNTYLTMSAENKAEEEKKIFLLTRSTFNRSNNLIWQSLDEINQLQDVGLVQKLLYEFVYFLYGLDVKKIRYIARGGGEAGKLWRVRWRASIKTGSPLFPGPTTDWDINKTLLAYWSMYYDSIFESIDKPEDSVVEDDELCDKWVEEINRKYEKRAKEMSQEMDGRSKFNPHSSALNHDEVIMFDDYFEDKSDWEFQDFLEEIEEAPEDIDNESNVLYSV